MLFTRLSCHRVSRAQTSLAYTSMATDRIIVDLAIAGVPQLIHFPCETALGYAVERNQNVVVDHLIGIGTNVNWTFSFSGHREKKSVLYIALTRGNLHAVKALLDAGAVLDMPAMLVMCKSEHRDIQLLFMTIINNRPLTIINNK